MGKIQDCHSVNYFRQIHYLLDYYSMRFLDFQTIVTEAWRAFRPEVPLKAVTDISVRVSTNYVYKLEFEKREFLISKLSLFGKYDHFVEDHEIINALADKLPWPYDQTLARSLTKHGRVFTYRYQLAEQEVWVVFYRPVQIRRRLPKRLQPQQISNLGEQLAHFHRACTDVLPLLPGSSKNMRDDLREFKGHLGTEMGDFEYGAHRPQIERHIDRYLEQAETLGAHTFPAIPVFVDWNIGNFSLTNSGEIFSRWDYDWFRMSSRVVDFYFMSRVVSDIGDQSHFSYHVNPMMEDRFLTFLRAYHRVFPLSEAEIRFTKEAYRFFLLHYVVNLGRYFFHSIYATRLLKETFEIHLPRLEEHFDTEKLLQACSSMTSAAS